MKQTAQVINFPQPRKTNKNTIKRIKNIDGVKYYTTKQIQLLRRTVREQAQLAIAKHKSRAQIKGQVLQYHIFIS